MTEEIKVKAEFFKERGLKMIRTKPFNADKNRWVNNTAESIKMASGMFLREINEIIKKNVSEEDYNTFIEKEDQLRDTFRKKADSWKAMFLDAPAWMYHTLDLESYWSSFVSEVEKTAETL